MKLDPLPGPTGLRSLHRSKRHQEQGVALVTVLAIVLLMTVLIMSFLTMGMTELNAAQKDNDNLRVRSLADAAVNMVIGQIREATTAPKAGAASSFLPWSSQPGGIRVYQPWGDLQRIYKLYSSRSMSAASLKEVESSDLRRDWNRHPDVWVDMNAPVIVPNSRFPDDLNRAEFYFPIVDPRARRAQVRDSVEGFDYEGTGVSGIVKAGGGGSNSQRLPMPVRWLYILADGSIGHLTDSGEFLAGAGGKNPTRENPIVGRVAFWADDETCKINVNTASEGVYWDTPRTSSDQDANLGRYQPKNGEYQRYPGHPAMVCLSSVLFPWHRWVPTGEDNTVPGSPMKSLAKADGQSIWRMAPFIYGEENDGSFGGTKTWDMRANALGTRLVGQPNPKHLYNSQDDYLMAATSDARINGNANDIDVKERDPVDQAEKIGLPVDRIQQGRFFLTTRSSGPEVNLLGTPRMSLWPINNTVDTAFTSSSYNASSAKFSVFDTLIAFNSSLQRQVQGQSRPSYPYYFQREDAGSRHAEFYTYSETRNEGLFNYVNNLAHRDIPGFTLKSGATGGYRRLGEKYRPGQQDDLAAIMTLMFDYIRNQNLYDGNIRTPTNRYVSNTAYGQVTPICLCGSASTHSAIWFNATIPLPKGVGRFLTVSEVSLIVSCRSKQSVTGAIDGDPYFPATHASRIPGMVNIELEAGILIEGFSPSHGWGEYRPWASFQFGGESRGKLGKRAGNEYEINPWLLNRKPLLLAANDSRRGVATTGGTIGRVPSNWAAWGGNLGVRFVEDMINFQPIILSVPTGGNLPPMDFSGSTASGASHPRIIVYDNNSGASSVSDAADNVDEGNLIQCIPLPFPSITPESSLRLPSNPGPKPTALDNRLRLARDNVEQLFSNSGLIRPTDIVQSLVPAHSDFRLLAAKRTVMNGRSPGTGSDPREFPTFVAHPSYGRSPQAHNIREPMPRVDEEFVVPKTRPGNRSDEGGYFESNVENIRLEPVYRPDFPIQPWGNDPIRLVRGLTTSGLANGVLVGGREDVMSESEVFVSGRYDRRGGEFERGSCEPGKTGDFDTGVAMAPDGPYIGRGDDGESRGGTGSGVPYFSDFEAEIQPSSTPTPGVANFAPNRVVASAGVFGSLPTGVQMNVPWQTLLFRPDPEFLKRNPRRENRHFGSLYPRDHLLLDFFWMPVVEPYSISEPFETRGKINMNYQILPFTYIKRATALHALFKAEKLMAIPNNKADEYKLSDASGDTYQTRDNNFRHHIDAEQTLEQWERRFKDSDPTLEEVGIKPGAFISASEICDMWLVPEGHTLANLETFWETRKLTGDNLKERPYANLYPRLTTRSNSYRVHVIAQALRKVKGTDTDKFDPTRDIVAAEYRGSYLVERSVDPTDPDIPDYVAVVNSGGDIENPIDRFYTYRISQVKQFAR